MQKYQKQHLYENTEVRIQKKNNNMVILDPDSWLLHSHA